MKHVRLLVLTEDLPRASLTLAEVESFHPGPDAVYSLSDEMREQFIALFPHKKNLHDFGRMLWPRFDVTPE